MTSVEYCKPPSCNYEVLRCSSKGYWLIALPQNLRLFFVFLIWCFAVLWQFINSLLLHFTCISTFFLAMYSIWSIFLRAGRDKDNETCWDVKSKAAHLHGRRLRRLKHFFSLDDYLHQTSCTTQYVDRLSLTFASHLCTIHLKIDVHSSKLGS